MQIEIGEGDKFRAYGKQYVAVRYKYGHDKCVICALKHSKLPCYYFACIPELRQDKKNIYFEEVNP